MDNKFLTLIVIAFLGTTISRTLRMGTAFLTISEGFSFLSLLAATFAIGRILSSYLSGISTEKYGSKVASLGISVIALTGLGYAVLPAVTYLPLRILHGLASGIAWPSLQTLVMSSVGEEKRGRASSLYFIATNSAWILAFLIGSIIDRNAMVVSSALLILIALVMLKLDVRVGVKAKKGKGKGKKRFVPPNEAIALGGLAVGFMTLLVNTEVAIAVLGLEFEKTVIGIVLAVAALIGAVVSYLVNRKLIDYLETHLSLLLPSVATPVASTLIYVSPMTSSVGVLVTKAAVSWWRSTLLGLSRAQETGKRVGLFNSSADAGRIIGAFIASQGAAMLPILSALSFVLGLASWTLSLKSRGEVSEDKK
ncbi:hypothetical protein EYM_04680 [Ignicoccus islandicus DSM 13165]|uniref:MFS transporter n=1 Tax=Ignicoccus islandicus DSM 13165 TaxID=940295 RepID=A0A0U3FQA8_9CREN|nr:MFS transporter [Ignicoccus islandicus]ALU12511.1 hypothetical protein EYM_04680 [Ignicoccus islandicus DSM 13165]